MSTPDSSADTPASAATSTATDAGAATAELPGLSAREAADRLAADGPNSLPGGHRRTLWAMAAETAREPMFLLLLAAATLYLVLGDRLEGLTLLGFVGVTLGLTLYQEGRTEQALNALRALTSPRALVVRDGQPQRVAGADVVAGDLLQLREGDRVAADAWVLSADGLRADESLLTGEPVPVDKTAAPQGPPAAVPVAAAAPATSATSATSPAATDATATDRARPRPGGDGLPQVYAGTLIVQGHALARVTATGVRSEIGRIGAALDALTPEPTPLQQQTGRLVRQLALLALALSLALVLVYGLLRGDWLQALLAGIALAMSMLPEEYPMVLTVFPALGARRLARHGVLTRRITAIETLGAISVLCTDKTGTLTENRMTVTHLVAGGPTPTPPLALAGMADGALPEADRELVGFAILASVVDPFDPMEKAFHQLGQHFLKGSAHLHPDWRLVHTYALSPALRAMSQVWATAEGGTHTVAAKGAPEAVMALCHLDATATARVSAQVDALAAQGLRVLAVASARFDGTAWPADEHGFDFAFLGLLGLADPLRPQVPTAIANCTAAGIRVMMITGDYPATARAIATQAGLPQTASSLLTGDDVATLDDAALGARLATVSVCARIAPDQKLRIVQALRARGDIVAMTGDGVNDAPALRAAHVGVAMGGRGTDVAREAASLVLIDDDFAAIVHAVRLGRLIFDNLRKAMSYVLAVHVPIAGMALVPVLLGWPVMLYPMHIALLELIIDPACAIAFENEPAEPDLMRRPPRDVTLPLFGGATLGLALVQGLAVLATVAAALGWADGRLAEPEARAFAFTTLVVANLGLILSNRSATAPIWQTLRTPNRMLWAVIGLATTLLLTALYWPWATRLLRFSPLPGAELAAAAALGGLSVVWFELIKSARRRRSAPSAGPAPRLP